MNIWVSLLAIAASAVALAVLRRRQQTALATQSTPDDEPHLAAS